MSGSSSNNSASFSGKGSKGRDRSRVRSGNFNVFGLDRAGNPNRAGQNTSWGSDRGQNQKSNFEKRNSRNSIGQWLSNLARWERSFKRSRNKRRPGGFGRSVSRDRLDNPSNRRREKSNRNRPDWKLTNQNKWNKNLTSAPKKKFNLKRRGTKKFINREIEELSVKSVTREEFKILLQKYREKSTQINLKVVSKERVSDLIGRIYSRPKKIYSRPLQPIYAYHPLNVAINYLEQKNYEKATPILEVLANDNNPVAQLLLAQLNWSGLGSPQQFETAYLWSLNSFLGGETEALPIIADLEEFLSKDAQKLVAKDLKSMLSERAFNGDFRAVSQVAAWYSIIAEPEDNENAYSWSAVAAALGDKDFEPHRDALLLELSPAQLKFAQLQAGQIFRQIKANTG